MSAKIRTAVSPSQRDRAGPIRVTGINSAMPLNGRRETLAVGVAATLGIAVFYNWREKRLARSDPEGYARLLRLKAAFRTNQTDAEHGKTAKNSSLHAAHYRDISHKIPGPATHH